jgi:TRAP-type C4-dicarboxylate transport system permease small subunit
MMGVLLGLITAHGSVNAAILSLGRGLGAVCMAGMVVIILAQVFFRYVIGTALPWPEEAARFLMLWAAGLMIATAFRRGGFVSIDMLVRLLPVRVASALSFLLLGLSLVILVVAIQISWGDVTGIGGRFETDSLKVPMSFDGGPWTKVPRAWQMMSMLVGLTMMISVCVELMLRNVIVLFAGADRLPAIPDTVTMGAE